MRNSQCIFPYLKSAFKFSIIAFSLSFQQQVSANKIVSVSDGNWEDSAVWLNGNLPGYSFGDTVDINHCIFFNEDLQLSSGAFLTLKDSGKICGHHNIYLNHGSEFDIFGRIYFDTIFVQGYLYIKNNNQAWIGQCIIYNGGGHGWDIGPGIFTYYPFTCSCTFDSIPSFPKDSVTDINNSAEIEAYPNPFHDLIYLKNDSIINSVNIFDDRGRLILQRQIIDNHLDLRNLFPAPYFFSFILKDGRIINKKIIKL